jgi:hypothetical protein
MAPAPRSGYSGVASVTGGGAVRADVRLAAFGPVALGAADFAAAGLVAFAFGLAVLRADAFFTATLLRVAVGTRLVAAAALATLVAGVFAFAGFFAFARAAASLAFSRRDFRSLRMLANAAVATAFCWLSGMASSA